MENTAQKGNHPVSYLRALWHTQGMAEAGIAKFTIGAWGMSIEGQAELPAGPATVESMLPVLHGIGSALVQIAVKGIEHDGHKISCKAGCGACCRQLVPISEHEARAISDMVLNFPEPRRTQVLLRFREANIRLDEAGLRKKIENLHLIEDSEERVRIGMDYFRMGVPCPFLEDESCSIHPVRPMACREYLVTSDAEFCKNPGSGKVVGVRLPGKPSQALNTFGLGDGDPRYVVIPLILSLFFAAANPTPEPVVDAPDMLHRFLRALEGETERSAAAAQDAPEQG